MVILLKIKRTDYFQRGSIPILASRIVKTQKFKLLFFEMERAAGLETCTKIYILFTAVQPSVIKNS